MNVLLHRTARHFLRALHLPLPTQHRTVRIVYHPSRFPRLEHL